MFNARDAKVVIEAMQLDPKKFTVLVIKVPPDAGPRDYQRAGDVMRDVTRDWPNVRWFMVGDGFTVEAFEHDPQQIPHG